MDVGVDRRGIVWFLPALGFGSLIILFCYNLLFATVSPGTSLILVFLGALLCTLLFYVLLVLAARVSSGGSGSRLGRLKIVLTFLLLYSCSGYGISSAYMLLFEGPAILRDHINGALRAYAQLKAVSERDLPIPEYEEIVRRVRSSQSGLIKEILNPAGQKYCGVGGNARAFITEISRDLRGFTVLAGTANIHDCSDLALMQRIADAYVQDIDERLRNHPILAQKKAAPRLELQRDIEAETRTYTAHLTDAASRLSGVANLVFNYSLFGRTSAVLQQASADYLILAERLAAISPKSVGEAPAAIDISMLHRLVSGFEIPKVLIERIDRPVTWLAFILPAVIDAIFVGYARLVLSHYRRQRRIAQGAWVGQTNVSYLWRPISGRG